MKAADAEEARELESLFRHEAFTTAALDHPNIVPVYDFGTDDAGRPMMAMKLVRGDNWDVVLRSDHASMSSVELITKHLQVLAGVAQAVVFAHDAGVIHRDIKPAQVMLGPYGEVLLMDWGLAVLIDAPAPDSPLSAHERERIAPRAVHASSPAGTPAYMAPEQTEDDASRIGPWTDVYLLGGILYFILTAARPHESQTAAHAFELARSGQIVPPAERAPDRTLPQDLVHLTMRALEPDPGKRTLTAREFHAAILEHLTGASRRRESMSVAAEAIRRADPMPSEYGELSDVVNLLDRARMLWPENPAAGEFREKCLASLGRMSISQGDLLLSRATIGRLSSEALRGELSRELEQATAARLRQARERKTLRLATVVLAGVVLIGGGALLLSLSRERTVAQASRARAEDLLGFMLGDMREKLEPLGRIEVLDSVVTRAQAYLKSIPESERDLSSRLQRIRTEAQIAGIEMARGNQEEGQEILDEQARISDALLREHPHETGALAAAAEVQAALGRVLTEKGELARGGEAKSRALALYGELRKVEPGERLWAREYARVALDLGDDAVIQARRQEGFAHYDDALTVMAEWQRREPRAREWQYTAAVLHLHTSLGYGGKSETAERIARTEKGLALTSALIAADPDDLQARSVAGMLNFVKGTGLSDAGNLEEGVRVLRASCDTLRAVTLLEPANRDWYTDYLQAYAQLGGTLLEAGQAEEGIAILKECAEKLEGEIAANPENVLWSRDLAMAHTRLAMHYEDKGEWVAACHSGAKAAAAMIPIWRGERSVRAYEKNLLELAEVLWKCTREVVIRGKPALVMEDLRVQAELEALLGENATDGGKYRARRVDTMTFLAIPLCQSGRYADAALVLRELASIMEASDKVKSGDPFALAEKEALLGLLTGCNEETAGNFEKAAESFERAANGYTRCAVARPSDRGTQRALAATYFCRVASLRLRLGEGDRAREVLAEAERQFELATEPGDGVLTHALTRIRAQASLYLTRGRILRADGDAVAAREMFERVVAIAAEGKGWGDVKSQDYLAVAYKELGRVEEAQAIIDQLDREGDLTEWSRRAFNRIGQ